MLMVGLPAITMIQDTDGLLQFSAVLVQFLSCFT